MAIIPYYRDNYTYVPMTYNDLKVVIRQYHS